MEKDKKCVYTILIGEYEKLNEQPVAQDSNIDFFCFTEDNSIKSETWKIIHVDPIFPYDTIRSARTIKIAPHRFLSPEFSSSLYIDNSIKLKAVPEEIFTDFSLEEYDLHLLQHSFREKVFDEFEEVLRINYDKPNLIIEQLNAYSMIAPSLFDEKPIWTGFMLRNHNKLDVINMMEDWLAQVMRYSRRDQLSINYVICKHKPKINLLDLDNHSTIYHQWPTAQRYGSPATKSSLSDLLEHNLRIEAVSNELKNLNETLEELEIILAEKENTIQYLNNTITEKEQHLTKIIAEIEQSQTERVQTIERLTADLAELEQEVLFYALSDSWRITRPLRKLKGLLRGKKLR